MGTRGQILKYTLLPGFLPRIMALFSSGFAHIAYTMAVVYSAVRLLPPNHPYLDPHNIGRFGIRHVIAEAANKLEFKKNKLDQIIIFFGILFGLILLFGQFFALILVVIANNPVLASPLVASLDLFINDTAGGNAFGSQGPTHDLAFIILDSVFGTQGIFGSCLSDSVAGNCEDTHGEAVPWDQGIYPWAMHSALHSMFQFYSYGIFIISVMVIIYFVISIVAETAESGTPFGQRFNKTWAPIRLILFMAMLIPLNVAEDGRNAGLNGAQLITLNIAKYGSNFATNAWSYFNGGTESTAAASASSSDLSRNILSQQQSLIAQNKLPSTSIMNLIQFMHIAKTCQIAYNTSGDDYEMGETPIEIQAYLVRPPPTAGMSTTGTANHSALDTTDFEHARAFFFDQNMYIRFGMLDPEETTVHHRDRDFQMARGNVIPFCGEVVLPIGDISQPGTRTILEGYYNIVRNMWLEDVTPPLLGNPFINESTCIVEEHVHGARPTTCPENGVLTQDFVDGLKSRYIPQFRDVHRDGITAQQTDGEFGLDNRILRLGWIGASLYYNKIAEMNGSITTASMAVPYQTELPFLMQQALMLNVQQNENVQQDAKFDRLLSDIRGLRVFQKFNKESDGKKLIAMNLVYNFWQHKNGATGGGIKKPTGNIIIDFLNVIFGTSGLYEMRENTTAHPLAQLSVLGKSMMDATIRNLGLSMATAMGGSIAKIFDQFTTDTLKTATGFLSTMGLITIGIAAILYYVLPMLPFIYFIFAASGWIKSIFEAMVAMPLWALAHLRIDGEGLPGQGATNGYFLLMEIFLRPILILVGFLASISMFAASVNTLNLIFDLVVANIGGNSSGSTDGISLTGGALTASLENALTFSRGPIDEFFFTAMYAIICYMIGLSCFKLVDLIPNNILRWAGVSASTFQENAGDPAGQLTNRVYKGSLLIGNQIKGQTTGNLSILAAGS